MKLKPETVKAIYDAVTKDFDDWDWEEYSGDMEKLKKATKDTEVVNVFIDMAWDLPAFVDFITDLDIPRKELKAILGEATLKQGEWST